MKTFLLPLLLLALVLPAALGRVYNYGPSRFGYEDQRGYLAATSDAEYEATPLRPLSAAVQATTGFPKAGATYAFKADNGKYLSRIRRSGIDYIEAAKDSVDVFSKFLCILLEGNKVAFQGDDGNWLYLSRIYRGGVHNIESAKPAIDYYSEFTYETDHNGNIYLKADNDRYWTRVNRGGRDNIEAATSEKGSFNSFTAIEV